jgi:hypothetical protein
MTARMEVLPFRREPRTIAIDVEACRAEVTRALPPDWATWRATTAELSSALDEARAKYSGDSRARASALAEAVASLAVAWTSLAAGWSVEGPGMDPLQPTVAPLVDLWVAEHGIDYALDALVAAYGVMQTMSPTQIEPASDRVTASRQPGRWRRLREHVCASGDATYAAARAHAESLRTRAAWGARFITSFVFPSEAEWARADAASSSGVQRLALVGTAIDGRTCAKILRNADDAGMIFEDGRFATMVEMLGDDAIEPLRAVMTMQRLDLSVPTALLARFATPEVATTMVGALDRREAEPAREFFRKNPELALGALVTATTTSAAHARRTKPLLASAVARAHERALEMARKTKNVRVKNLLAELGATEAWLGKKKPKRLLDAVAKFPSVTAWMNAGAPWSGREALREIREPAEIVALVRAAANDALPIAMAAIDVLVELPDPLKWLGRIEHAPIRPEVDEHARCRARELQAVRGLVDDDVDDLAAPSFANVLDFGGRRFFARLDAEMKPALFDADGKRVAALPRAGKHDDAERAARATDAWTIFRDDAASEAGAQAERMEQAMLAGREFPDEIFRGVVVPHPVLGALARRLVWRDARGVLFRVAEDGSFASAEDAVADVRAPVRIADPSAMTSDERFRWSEVMASYEIVQPFEQLGRT